MTLREKLLLCSGSTVFFLDLSLPESATRSHRSRQSVSGKEDKSNLQTTAGTVKPRARQ